ncbi:MAG TPA: TIM barrel protein [Longilinea sp.]|nr:TIM barrel protein [Longilinea sp.]
MTTKKPILGTTLYSFTNEWQQRLYTLDQMVEKVAELKLGPAVEVVGFQSFRTYPDVTDEFARHFRDLLDKHSLIPSCLGANLDFGRRKDRLMTDEEKLAYIQRQLVTANKLGYPVMRIQNSAGPKVFEALEPLARRAKVHVACELHSPLSVDNPEVVELRTTFDRIGSEYLGFIPDFSTSMTSVPEVYWSDLREVGASEELIEAAKTIWNSNQSNGEKFGDLAEAAAHYGANPAVGGQLNMAMTMFGRMPVDGWRELLPYARHIHGKFYHVDETGKEPSIPYPDLIKLLKDTGYQGTISAEWEGHAFTDRPIGFEEVSAWRTMCDRLLAG